MSSLSAMKMGARWYGSSTASPNMPYMFTA